MNTVFSSNAFKALTLSFTVMVAAGCSSLTSDQAIVPLQTETAKILGLASSDEITVTRVTAETPDALGGQTISYRATTDKGRIFDCHSFMIPGFLGSKPDLSLPKCSPILTHK